MKEVRHFGIVVSDVEKSLDFYGNNLGLEIKVDNLEEGNFIDTILGIKNVKVRTIKMIAKEGKTMLEILHYKSHKGEKRKKYRIFDIGASHPAFTVKDINEEYKKLKKRGVKFISSPQISPNGKAKVAFCIDPDGVPVELVQVY